MEKKKHSIYWRAIGGILLFLFGLLCAFVAWFRIGKKEYGKAALSGVAAVPTTILGGKMLVKSMKNTWAKAKAKTGVSIDENDEPEKAAA